MKTISNKIGLALLLCLIPKLFFAQMTLPFFDDFSTSKNLPDSTKWIDRNAFVNAGFPLNPITRNAATLDVLDANGRVYGYAISNPFVAESLTSTAIRLDSVFDPTPKALTPADSLYLSFFYQPQGNGNSPEAQDSLVLVFGLPNEIDTTWHHIWSTPGQTLEQFMEENDGNYFKQVMIPINDLQYFTPNFLFRFYNYASIASPSEPSSRGNEDNWNIDMVYLNWGRSIHDTSYPKVSFTGTNPSFLKRYQAMPYKHYRANPTSSIAYKYEIKTSNLDNAAHQLEYYYTVEEINGSQFYEYKCNPISLNAEKYAQPDTAMVNDLFHLNYHTDSASFIIRHYISDSTCNPPLVDSLVYRQDFYNYFAYDDGTPEMGFGVRPSSGAFAVKFELSEVDTLRGVQILFNHTLNDANNMYFDIVVWKDNNGKPGDEVYRLTNRRPKWEDQLYKFVYYKFDKRVRLNGVFYVGIVQQGNGLINVGFDTSKDNSQYNFINVTGSWQQSTKPGSIMIRPVVGANYYIGVDENTVADQISVYPNPASSTLHIEGVSNGSSIALYDITGRKVMQTSFTDEIPVSQLSDGLYLLNITTVDGSIVSRKIMVRR